MITIYSSVLTNVLQKYLNYRIESKGHTHPQLDKFRLLMKMTPVTEDILDNLLASFAQESSLKELDLNCLRRRFTLGPFTLMHLKSLSFQALVNVNSLIN